MKYVTITEYDESDNYLRIYICQYTHNEIAFDRISDMINDTDFNGKEYVLSYGVKITEKTADRLSSEVSFNFIQKLSGIFIFPKNDDFENYEWFDKYFVGGQVWSQFV